MKRRTFIATTGVAALGSVAGCLGDGGYRTLSVDGESVPLAPINDVAEWFENDEARFADARSRAAYDNARIAGAVLSPAPNGLPSEDPAEEWATDTRIVTYCACPHHLSSQRAASLISAGYTDVYALDEGFREWLERDLPVEGASVAAELPAYEIRGRSDPVHAGENVWVREPLSGQREVTPIDTDGSYAMELPFVDVTPETRLELEAPDYTLEATLEELTADVVTASL